MSDTATADAIRDVLAKLTDWLERESQRLNRIEEADTVRAKTAEDSRLANKRDWLAGQAMTGMMAAAHWDGVAYEDVAGHAYAVADAMLKAKEGR